MSFGRVDICFFCKRSEQGYPAGPDDEHVCEPCRRSIYTLFAISDPWYFEAEQCDACFGHGKGQMRLSNGNYRDAICPNCDGARCFFKKKSPLILLAECGVSVADGQATESIETSRTSEEA